MSIYGVFHSYEVDGGFGDAVDTEELIGVTSDLSEAENFVKKFSLCENNMGAIYDIPYAALTLGTLVIRELNTLSINKCPYEDWMLNCVLREEHNSPQIKEKAKSLL